MPHSVWAAIVPRLAITLPTIAGLRTHRVSQIQHPKVPIDLGGVSAQCRGTKADGSQDDLLDVDPGTGRGQRAARRPRMSVAHREAVCVTWFTRCDLGLLSDDSIAVGACAPDQLMCVEG